MLTANRKKTPASIAGDDAYVLCALIVLVATFVAPIIHLVAFWPQPAWIVVSWLFAPVFWFCGAVFGEKGNHAPNEEHVRKIAWAVGWIVGGYGMWAGLADGVGFQSVSSAFHLASYQLGLWYWPKPKPAKPPVSASLLQPPPPTTFGSARWGTLDYMLTHKLVGGDGLTIGIIPGDGAPHRLRYAGDRHLLTIAPTGSGKGSTVLIPNLLTHSGSCLVVDPKGENALVTAHHRARMGQAVHVVDPWGIARDADANARFNPLDWLVAGDIDLAENAMLLADALVVPDGKSERFWLEEAKALLQGVILYVATDEHEDRHLGRVRDLLLLDGEDMPKLFQRMARSPHRVVASTGARSLQKEEKLLANVVASAQSHTAFLDSPRLRDNLSRSDFRFEDLKAGLTTVYLVLPADRLAAFGRWLRLLIQHALTVTARDVAHVPARPVLFILDEMMALGHLSMVEQAYGLMRGFGLQLWAIVQDVGQLKRVYGESWETFVANSGAVMYYGSRDSSSAEYFSKLCGEATVLNFSTSASSSITSSSSYSSGGQGGSYTSGTSRTVGHTSSTAQAQRKLAFPDELSRLGPNEQLVLIEHHRPILAARLPWFEDREVQRLGRNLRLPACQQETICPAVGRLLTLSRPQPKEPCR